GSTRTRATASSPRTTAQPTSSSTTPPSRWTGSAPSRRTSGSSTPLAAAPRARRRKRFTRSSTSRTTSRTGGPGGDRPVLCLTEEASGHRSGHRDQAAVGEVAVSLLGRGPGQLDAAQALVGPVAGPGELVHRVAAVEVVRVVHRVVVLRTVRVGAVHVREVVLQVDGEGAVHGRAARDAGVGQRLE